MFWKKEWLPGIFLEEKKFNIDGFLAKRVNSQTKNNEEIAEPGKNYISQQDTAPIRNARNVSYFFTRIANNTNQ